MTAAQMETQVVVVGAGPVGLMLAGELRLGGADVVVLEQRDVPTAESRASTLHARTMEILDSRGLLGGLGTPPCEPRGHFGGIPLDLSLPSSHPGQWKVPQTRTEELLQEWAVGLGARLLRGHRVRALRTTPDHVEAETDGPGDPVRVRGRFLAGCDGEHSTVRILAGASFPGQDARRELLRADVSGIAIPDRRFQRMENGLAIAARRGDGVTRVMVYEFGRRAGARTSGPGPADVSGAWKTVTGEDISGGTFLWVNAFSDANRQLACYRHDRILFAGDAAHQQMPTGGQALNLGLQDAVNLGWKLAAGLAGTAPAGLLDTYHTERHAVGRRVLANIRAQAVLLLGGAEVEPVRALLGELMALPDVRARLAAMICGLDIRYDVGAGDDPLLGARLPPRPPADRRGSRHHHRGPAPGGPGPAARPGRSGRGAAPRGCGALGGSGGHGHGRAGSGHRTGPAAGRQRGPGPSRRPRRVDRLREHPAVGRAAAMVRPRARLAAPNRQLTRNRTERGPTMSTAVRKHQPGEAYDVAILGAGMAGAMLGAVLARNGVRVLLIDAGSHPRFAVGESTIPYTSATTRIIAERYQVPEIEALAGFRTIQEKVIPTCGRKQNFGFVYHQVAGCTTRSRSTSWSSPSGSAPRRTCSGRTSTLTCFTSPSATGPSPAWPPGSRRSRPTPSAASCSAPIVGRSSAPSTSWTAAATGRRSPRRSASVTSPRGPAITPVPCSRTWSG